MHMNLASRQVAQSARVIEVQMPEKHDVDVLGRQTQPPQVSGNPLVLGHLRRLEEGPHGIEVPRPQLGSRDLSIIAPDVIQNAALGVWMRYARMGASMY